MFINSKGKRQPRGGPQNLPQKTKTPKEGGRRCPCMVLYSVQEQAKDTILWPRIWQT